MSTKFLLTSYGITNASIKNALLSLAWGNFSDKNLLFIPTAQNPKTTDKSRLVRNFNEFLDLWFKVMDIIDIAIEDRKIIQDRIKSAHIICFWWWNALYLKTKLFRNSLLQEFQKIFDEKIIVWISAGSIVWGKNIKEEKDMRKLKDIWVSEVYNWNEYNLFDFTFIPHFGRSDYPQYSRENVEIIGNELQEKIYALDDESALLIDWDKREIISEWYYRVYN